jgi:two-component system chemotaxis response regulator CheY
MINSILIVDDSWLTRSLIRRTIQIAGVTARELYEAGDGEQAMNILHEHPVTLVLADLQMPVVGGNELIRRMKAEPGLSLIPVIIVSADPDTEHLDSLRANGVNGCLRKPFTPEELLSALRPIFGDAA